MKLLIHGGAGSIPRNDTMRATEPAYIAALQEALRAGFGVLQKGGSSLDAVVEAVASLEDCPLFNAGRGSVLNKEGHVEMDASVMWGRTLAAGAVAGVSQLRNPVRAARVVMEQSKHVMLIGAAADRYAAAAGCETADESYLITPERLQRWKSLSPDAGTELDHAGIASDAANDSKHGTVGAVARDSEGTLAAATSTGGMMNKLPGRVGDTPIIGAGTLADDNTVAVSFTGTGEQVIRLSSARSLSALIQHMGMPLEQATQAILDQLRDLGGVGGLIAIDRLGNHVLKFNTPGMFRGWIDASGRMEAAIYA